MPLDSSQGHDTTNGPDENESPFDQTPEEIEAQREEAAKRERKATRKARRAAKREAAEAQTQDAQPRRGGEPPALVVAPPTDADGATHWLDETPERRSPVAAGKTERGLEAVLDAMKVKLRWNVLSQKVEYQAAAEGEGWQELDDRWEAKLRQAIARCFADGGGRPLSFTRDAFRDAVNAMLVTRRVHPFAEWLEALPAWDGCPRLDAWVGQAFIVREGYETLASWAGRFVFLGAVWRTYQPGTKLDEFPVLIGKGGIGKSTALRHALPERFQDAMFDDSLNLASDAKVRIEAIQGRVIVELSEMAGAQRADYEGMKAFISRTDDGSIRAAYARNPEPRPRRCVFVGTADTDRPLPNDANLRRFGPVVLEDGNPAHLRAFMDSERTQLWAEALALYREGREARLPDELKLSQKEATDRARAKDLMLEDALLDYLARAPEHFALSDCANAVMLIGTPKHGATVNPVSEKRLVHALRLLGYEAFQGRDGGGKRRYWARA